MWLEWTRVDHLFSAAAGEGPTRCWIEWDAAGGERGEGINLCARRDKTLQEVKTGAAAAAATQGPRMHTINGGTPLAVAGSGRDDAEGGCSEAATLNR